MTMRQVEPFLANRFSDAGSTSDCNKDFFKYVSDVATRLPPLPRQ